METYFEVFTCLVFSKDALEDTYQVYYLHVPKIPRIHIDTFSSTQLELLLSLPQLSKTKVHKLHSCVILFHLSHPIDCQFL